MTQLGRLWGTVRYLHPYLMDREIDWDAALVAALPKVEAARSREEYAAAVQGMLDALGDPVTRVLPPEAPAEEKPADKTPPPLTKRLDDGTLVLDFAHAARAMGYRDLMRSINAAFQDVSRQKAVIVDLRGGSAAEDPAGELFSYALDQVGNALLSRPCRAPSQRYVLRSGYQTQEGSSSGSYYEGFVTPAAQSFAPAPASPEKPTVEKRVVFLVGRGGSLPKLALALQAVGDARVVAEGPIGEASVVATQRVPIGEDLFVRLRVSERVPMPGWPGVHADVEVTPSDGKTDPAMNAALAELKKDGWGQPVTATSSNAATLPEAVFRPDKTYPDMTAPDLGHRRLAVIRAWSVIHFFYPYLHLIGDWDAVLPEFLAKMEKADTARAYAETVLEMMTHVPDGHTGAYGHPEMAKIQGEAGVPVAVRWIENAPVVTAVGSEEIKAAGLAPGDAIVAVDGEPVAARFERLKRFVTAATEGSLQNRLCAYLLRGPEGPVTVTVQGLDGATREIHLQRALKTRFTPPPQGDVVRLLPGKIGYVDLTRLTIPEVEDAFERLKGTKAIIFDMRGYPQGTAWFVAPRINTNHAKVGAQFRRAQVSAFSTEEGDAGFFFAQPLPELPAGAALYTGPTVMLIDDRAISQSEHSGLFYEAANGTKFIGTPTSGANGDVTTFTLPGNIRVTFTGHDVRHADGRQLQRVGLKPDIEVAPTRKGIRDGKDEVLERAVEYLTAVH
jgi:C-terminal processing protease CtpA/Prc